MNWLSYFAGAWRMARRIDDRRGAREGRAEGEAAFASDASAPGALICAERLAIDYGGRTFAGEQATRWRFRDGAVELEFRDGGRCGAVFESVGGKWRAVFAHPCGEDRYDGEARVEGAGAFSMVWRVVGPRKDYTLHTDYFRLPAAAAGEACQNQTGGAGSPASAMASWEKQ
ncbi:MAG: DUF6314 family protein [Pseudomonadota bacterium]|nr:DUF6314 family protein [Pseudomonadota bacterium]